MPIETKQLFFTLEETPEVITIKYPKPRVNRVTKSYYRPIARTTSNTPLCTPRSVASIDSLSSPLNISDEGSGSIPRFRESTDSLTFSDGWDSPTIITVSDEKSDSENVIKIHDYYGIKIKSECVEKFLKGHDC